MPSAWYCIVEYGDDPVCRAHHTPTPSDTVVRSADGTVAEPAPVLTIAVVAVDTSDEKDTTAATLEALMARGEPGETE